MDDLRRHFEGMGFGDVGTFIASGNVTFDAGRAAPTNVENKIEDGLLGALGYEVTTFVRTSNELRRVVTAGDSVLGKVSATESLYVGFLKEAPAADVRKKIQGLGSATDSFTLEGPHLYWKVSGGLMDSSYSGSDLEKMLGRPMTLRSITMLRKLIARLA